MSEKKAAPQIEDVMSEVLSGDTLKDALEFVAYLRENRINPQWSATNAWKISYKSFSVAFLRVHGAADYYKLEAASWNIIPFIGEYDGACLSDEFKDIVWAHKKTCRGCGLCALKLNTVFGKEYDYVCEKATNFTNPNAIELECVKALIDLRRNAIKAGEAKRHKYVPVRDR